MVVNFESTAYKEGMLAGVQEATSSYSEGYKSGLKRGYNLGIKRTRLILQ